MEAIDEFIAKGKRTKRQRPQSPIPCTIAAAAAAATASHSSNRSENNDNIASPPSATSVNEFTSTDEEEDMAKCLILLARGGAQSSKISKPTNGRNREIRRSKFKSKIFVEAPPSTASGNDAGEAAAAGTYVYRCKTCDRTFPSFQALGGHRASHKKPKAVAAAEVKEDGHYEEEEEEEEEEEAILKKQLLLLETEPSSKYCSLSLQLGNRLSSDGLSKLNGKTLSPSKVHECSICGAEFASGQALGGHMRRHRAAAMGTASNAAAISLTSALKQSFGSESEDEEVVVINNDKPGIKLLSLDLDLNLPAPPEDDQDDQNRESNYAFGSKQQQKSPLVLSAAPTLVDCHY